MVDTVEIAITRCGATDIMMPGCQDQTSQDNV